MQENNDQCGALWVKDGQRGKYMSGVIEINGEKINIVVFKNGYKKEDKHPDYRILKSRPKNELSGNSEQLPDDNFEDDIPF